MARDLTAQFNSAKQKVANTRREVDRLEAQVEVSRESVQGKTQALADKGVTFQSDEDLEFIRKEKEGRVIQIVERMEQAMDMSSPLPAQPQVTQTPNVQVTATNMEIAQSQPKNTGVKEVDNDGEMDFGDFAEDTEPTKQETKKDEEIIDFADFE
ncbi:hypothetical protein [Bacillus thuringiensis]|uniref:hypothetical protein n=1 Tax=Bacillus thuringiensis TaxID=1428 RepID=UPI000BFB7BEE|nr:hypothetical protein [Bacillus thuringiensis]PGT89943.1 hypothetical protein COD17_09340 [Bacillus thuringiensis]